MAAADGALCLVLSGGVALGAYQAGVHATLQANPDLPVGWIAGSSVGAINAALIAGSPPQRRQETLTDYWLKGAPGQGEAPVPSGRPPQRRQETLTDYWLKGAPWQGEPLVRSGSLRHAFNWLSVAQGRLLGSPRHLRIGGRGSFYDLAPTVAFLKRSVDFERLNGGE